MIDEALILAAGLGGRLRQHDDDLPKPLHVVAGVPLIKRTILTLARAGIRRVVVVVGFMGDAIRASVAADPAYARAGVRVEFVDNPRHDLANGVSVLAARGHLAGPFVLSMSDHVYDASVARLAATCDLGDADLALCVDRATTLVYDIDDATKVRTDGDRIVAIGKDLTEFDAIDCGVFAAGPGLFAALESARAASGDCGLSDGVRALAARRRARVLDVHGAFWQDVDTPGARRRAERELLRGLRKPSDGPVARLVNRPLSLALTRVLLPTRVTPNQMTVVANLIGALGIVATLGSTWTSLALGAVLLQLQSVLDGCDGEIARLKFQASRLGEWLDNLLDDQVNVGYGLALGVAASNLLDAPIYRWLGLSAAAAFSAYNLVVYVQLALVHRTGNPFAFRWWYQSADEDLSAALARPGAANRVLAALRALGRRDFFLLAFMILALVRLPHVAVIWYFSLAAVHLVLAATHLARGGFAAARRAAVARATPPGRTDTVLEGRMGA